MKIKNLKLVKVGSSFGFVIPKPLINNIDFLKKGQIYDLEVQEKEELPKAPKTQSFINDFLLTNPKRCIKSGV